jgi:hypothetical protein
MPHESRALLGLFEEETWGSNYHDTVSLKQGIRIYNHCQCNKKKSKLQICRSCLSAICQGLCVICRSRGSWRRVLAKSAGSGEPVFTSTDALLYGP